MAYAYGVRERPELIFIAKVQVACENFNFSIIAEKYWKSFCLRMNWALQLLLWIILSLFHWKWWKKRRIKWRNLIAFVFTRSCRFVWARSNLVRFRWFIEHLQIQLKSGTKLLSVCIFHLSVFVNGPISFLIHAPQRLSVQIYCMR